MFQDVRNKFSPILLCIIKSTTNSDAAITPTELNQNDTSNSSVLIYFNVPCQNTLPYMATFLKILHHKNHNLIQISTIQKLRHIQVTLACL